ncbi:MAG: Gfo/Idh/MocA family oxidoreductase [Pseudomonadota bacterium]
MTVRVALVGAGVMGSDHARIIAQEVSGAKLQVVCDADAARARTVGDSYGTTDIATDPLATILRQDVDGVLVSSPDDTHADLTIAAVAAGKPVLCEKPLAPDAEACLKVIAAEVAANRPLIQVGFMRRFDPSYTAMKLALDSGQIGRPVMMHNFHRNVSVPDFFTGQMAISNSAPHEFDIARFVLGVDPQTITAFQGKGATAISPVCMVLETEAGQIITIEVNNTAAYGYDVRGELVGEAGSIDLVTPAHARLNTALQSATPLAEDWRPRFAEAYRAQNAAWIKSIETGTPDRRAATAWDGYCASVVAEAGVKSLEKQARVAINPVEKPEFYKRLGEKMREGALE